MCEYLLSSKNDTTIPSLPSLTGLPFSGLLAEATCHSARPLRYWVEPLKVSVEPLDFNH